MKSFIIKSAISLLLGFVIISCGVGNANQPKAVAKNFFNALQATNFEEAQKFATKDSKMILQLAQIAMNFSGKNKDTILQEISKHNFEYGEPVINGDEATIGVTIDKKEKINFTLKKEEGMWKMALDLNTLMKMGMGTKEEKSGSENDMNEMQDELKKLEADSAH
jgi:biotin-(acetyl-CoA carboxylase) ligase